MDIYLIVGLNKDNEIIYWDELTKNWYRNIKFATLFLCGLEPDRWEQLYIEHEYARQIALAREFTQVHISMYACNYSGDLSIEDLKELIKNDKGRIL